MENQISSLGFSRRQFLSKVLPACSLVCLGAGSSLLGFSPAVRKALQEAKHKFDEEFPEKFTGRQIMSMVWGRNYIPLLKFLSEELGRERLITLIRRHSAERGTEVGKMFAERSGGNDFAILKKIFSPGNPDFKNSLTFNVTEDTANVHEIKVTECIFANTFVEAKAGDLGFATVCYGDYNMASGFNPKVKMVRDKTLMQGHAYCNHRYLLEA
ncbi:L-2-amino-thiazoline-4-carboxylic acid hydrolase [Acidobacteriota bacterium]